MSVNTCSNLDATIGGSISCDDDEWQCNNGECVRDEYRCDGREDCQDDSDEVGCKWILCTYIFCLVSYLHSHNLRIYSIYETEMFIHCDLLYILIIVTFDILCVR